MTLLLTLALMIIFAAVIVPSITFEIRRDREEEMIHRGVQYSRAIRAYYRKYGRYPVRLEDLETTNNNQRFLRKRYKDPLTGQDFKLLHFGEVQLTLGGGMIPGASALGTPAGALNGPGGLGQGSAFGAQPGQNSAFGGNSSFGGSSGSAFGGSTLGASPQSAPAAGTDPTQSGSSNSSSSSSLSSSSSTPSSGDQTGSQNTGVTGHDQLGGQVFGGGPIVGVASVSKKDTIREFNHKKKYNEWQFVYDPGTDRGGLITTPNQPLPAGMALGQTGIPNLNGQNANNPNGSSFCNGLGGNTFGSSPGGLQNSPNSPAGGFGAQPQQPSNPQQPNNPQQ
jgi:type II secretory pathway pseudopilin PulG